MKNNIYIVLLAALMIGNVSARGLYEVAFLNTTDQEFSYSIDQFGDIEKTVLKTGKDIKGTIKPLDSKTGEPSTTSAYTTGAYLLNKVTITAADGKRMIYKIPSKASKNLRGKDWLFIITQEGTNIQICRKWANTQLQADTTLGVELTALSAAAASAAVEIAAANSVDVLILTAASHAETALTIQMVLDTIEFASKKAGKSVSHAYESAEETYKTVKKTVLGAFGLSRNLHKSGCSYLK